MAAAMLILTSNIPMVKFPKGYLALSRSAYSHFDVNSLFFASPLQAFLLSIISYRSCEIIPDSFNPVQKSIDLQKGIGATSSRFDNLRFLMDCESSDGLPL